MDLARARRILLCMRFGIGDVVMELPVLETLRRAAPRAHITALVAPPAIELLEGSPLVDDLASTARWNITHRWDEGTPETRAALDRWITEREFDTFLDVHHAAVAVGKVVWGRGIRSLEADERSEEQAVAAGHDAVAAIKAAVRTGWGLAVPDRLAPRIHLRDAERDAAIAALERTGAARPAPIALAPVASLPMKRWPAHRFAALADQLSEETGRPLLLLTGPQVELGDAVLSAMRHADRVARAEAPHLRQVAALLSRCALLVCNDTGMLHIAAAVGTPVVGVFGPTVPEIYMPRIPRAIGVVGGDIRCPHRNTRSLHPPGCWSSPHCLIATRSCVEQVPVDAALAAARRALAPEPGAVTPGSPAPPAAPDPFAA